MLGFYRCGCLEFAFSVRQEGMAVSSNICIHRQYFERVEIKCHQDWASVKIAKPSCSCEPHENRVKPYCGLG